MIILGEQWRHSASHIHVSILSHDSSPTQLAHDLEQSSMCYTVGPWWLPILNIAVCTEPSQTPFNFTSGGFLVLFSWLATVGICPLELREGNGGWSLPYKKRGTKKPECLGAPLGFTGKAGLFWRLRGECFPFPAWVLEAVGIPWLVVTSHQSLLPSSYRFLLWLWFLLHPFIKTLVIMSGLLDNPGSFPHLQDS